MTQCWKTIKVYEHFCKALYLHSEVSKKKKLASYFCPYAQCTALSNNLLILVIIMSDAKLWRKGTEMLFDWTSQANLI